MYVYTWPRLAALAFIYIYIYRTCFPRQNVFRSLSINKRTRALASLEITFSLCTYEPASDLCRKKPVDASLLYAWRREHGDNYFWNYSRRTAAGTRELRNSLDKNRGEIQIVAV